MKKQTQVSISLRHLGLTALAFSAVAYCVAAGAPAAEAQSSGGSSSSIGGTPGAIGTISAVPVGVCAQTSPANPVKKNTRCGVVVSVTDTNGNGLPRQQFRVQERRGIAGRWRNLGDKKRTDKQGRPMLVTFKPAQTVTVRALADLNGDKLADVVSTPFDIHVGAKRSSSNTSSSSSSQQSDDNSSSSQTSSLSGNPSSSSLSSTSSSGQTSSAQSSADDGEHHGGNGGRR